MASSPLKILYYPVDSGATGIIRLVRPMQLLHQKGLIKAELLDPRNPSQLDSADAVVMQCVVGGEGLKLIEKCKAKNIKTIVDYDDDFSNLSPVILNRNGWSQEEITAGWIKALRTADLITASCFELVRVIHKHVPLEKIERFPNYLVEEDFSENNPFNDCSEIRLLYSASESHLQDFLWIKGLLKYIGQAYPQVRIITQGKLDFSYYEPFYRGKHTHYSDVPFDSYSKLIKKIKPHLVIAPLLNNSGARCRSNLKFLQAGAIKAAFVGSDLPPYQEVIHKFNGLLVSSKISWWWNLRSLINNIKSAEMMALEGYNYCQKFKLENHVKTWINVVRPYFEE